MKKNRHSTTASPPRSVPRVHTVSGIVLNYEGRPELTFVRSPDVSARGMFVNTTREFPEGAILNVRFRLGLTGASVQARGEVRYCLPGVGIGLEFIGLDPETRHNIEREVALHEITGTSKASGPRAGVARRSRSKPGGTKKRAKNLRR